MARSGVQNNMTRVPTHSLGFFSLVLLLFACSSGATVLDRSDGGSADVERPDSDLPDLDSDLPFDAGRLPVDAHSPPPACAAPGRLALGGPGAPPAAPPITVSPNDADTLTGEGEISLVALESGILTVEIDLGAAGLRTFRIEDADAAPRVAIGATVQLDYRRVADSTRDVSHLVLRDPDGSILAVYVRAGGIGAAREIAAYLGERLDADLDAEVECRSSLGGYCGRGRIEYALVQGEERAAAGGSFRAITPSGPVTISVGVLADDNDRWPERTVCTHASLVAAELEAHGTSNADGTHYELVSAPLDFVVSHEGCATDGATVIVNATVHVYSSCHAPGPIFVDVDRIAHTVTLSPFVWSEVGRSDCRGIGAAYYRDVAIQGLTEGEWTITGITDPLRVGPRSPTACTALTPLEQGERCHADCDCKTGLSCIAMAGGACDMRCERPCEPPGFGGPDLSCGVGAICTHVGGVFGAVCRTQTADYCPASACSEGTSCRSDTENIASYCDWDVTLGSAARQPCTTNGDCGLGLDCVRHAGDTRTCEIRCTSTDMRCPGPHTCDPAATVEGRRGVCGWVGD